MMNSYPKTILITGGAGFIGSSFVRYALNLGHRVVVLDALTYAGHLLNLEGLEASGMFHFVKGDINDGALVDSLLTQFEVAAVIHMAAESHVDNSIASPSAFIQTNMVGTYTMLEACRQYWNGLSGDAKAKFRMVYVSTDEVFGSLGEQGIFTEESPLQPNSPYSASKAGGDLLTRAWFHTYGFPVITTHCTNNYGPRQHPEKLIPKMINNALEGKSLPIYGDGKNVRDWIYVDDHAKGVYLAMQKGQPGESYGFGGDCERRNNEVVEALCDILDAKCPLTGKSYRALITYVEDRLGHDRRYALDSSKAVSDLGFAREYSNMEAGLERTVDWYLANRDWCQIVGRKG